MLRIYSRRHKNGDVSVPSKRNTSVPFAVQFPFRACKRSINTLGVSYQRGRRTRASSFAREPRIDGCTLPLSSKLRWDTVLLPIF